MSVGGEILSFSFDDSDITPGKITPSGPDDNHEVTFCVLTIIRKRVVFEGNPKILFKENLFFVTYAH